MKVLVFILFALIFFVTPALTQSLIKQGFWHASINRPDEKQIVFNLHFAIEKSKTVLYIINAGESMRVPDVKIADDSIFINMPVFELGFRAKIISKDSIKGVWQRASIAKQIEIPFTATAKNPQRFTPVNGNPAQKRKRQMGNQF